MARLTKPSDGFLRGDAAQEAERTLFRELLQSPIATSTSALERFLEEIGGLRSTDVEEARSRDATPIGISLWRGGKLARIHSSPSGLAPLDNLASRASNSSVNADEPPLSPLASELMG